jgi:septal ring factor EnvC (AmiA/AmiB activator)
MSIDTEAEEAYRRFGGPRRSDPAKSAVTWAWVGKAMLGGSLVFLMYQAQHVVGSVDAARDQIAAARTDLAVLRGQLDDSQRQSAALERRVETLETKILGGAMGGR